MTSTSPAVLAGKVAVVTGAGGGIGQVYARALAEAGAAVVLADIAGPAAAKAAEDLRRAGHEALSVEADVTDQASVDAMAATAVERFGRIDVLVNNAALMAEIGPPDLMEMPIERWQQVLDVNLTGALRCVRAVVPSMRAQGYGKIVNQASGGAWKPSGVYGVSKLGLVSLTVSLAYQLSGSGIRVNAIAPGYVNTEAGLRAASPESRRMIEQTVPFPFGDPEDVCGALTFLVSPASDWITGQTLGVDGGWVPRL
jgi:NAD(P)-dependent dehydrogenase (short-subunit alcohol dehydrogenase family)